MLRDGSVTIENSDIVPVTRESDCEWRRVHGRLRAIRAKRAALFVEEARLLRLADELQLWRRFGYVTCAEYLERELGYAPREARECLRIADALGELGKLEAALASDALTYSAARELTRVMTSQTEDAWLEAAAGKSLREIEALVSGRVRGDLPDDPTDPAAFTRRLSLELPGEVYALWRQTRSALESERGEAMSDAEVIEAMCRRALEGGGDADRPAHQIAITVCDDCKRGWQNGAGREIEVDAATVARAQCDGEHLDASARVTSPITRRRRRQVFIRDHHRCSVPHCRASRNLDVHHVVPRSHGGSSSLSNLTLLCSGHHRLLHEGKLSVRGEAPDRLVFEPPPVTSASGDVTEQPPDSTGPSAGLEPGAEDARRQACLALVTLGFRSRDAHDAVRVASTHVGRDAPLETVLREALRGCARR